jgi:hypothetical protein
MNKKILVFLSLLTLATPVFAIGVTIATALLAGTAYAAFIGATAFAINMVVAVIVTKAFATQPSFDSGTSGSSPNPGNRQQIPPASDNKLPVVYGSAYVGGMVTDLSISEDNQQLYYVLSICEVTNTNPGQIPDNITFGDVYFGGKKVIFASSTSPDVTGLLDESTGVTDTTVNGKIQIFLYKNGSNNPVRGTQTAIQVMQTSGLQYTWDNNKLMTNCAFAILHLSYSQSANIRGLENTKFQVTNSRTSTGDCFSDYLINTRYGCAIASSQIDNISLDALTTYSNGSFAYIDSDNLPQTQPRFKFNGTLDTSRSVMSNLQDMATCCDCLIKYNEITAKWGVIVQSPTYTAVMDINDSNMISAIQITPMDIAASYNVIECKFPDNSNQDSFNSTTFDLSEIDPSLLYPNEPVNKLSLSLPLTNNSVTAQYIANRFLKAGREDLQVEVTVSFVGIQLDAGDIVTLTNANYGWTAKPFRINKVVQQFNDDGSIAVQLNMSEYNATVYDDVSITEFATADNSGIGDPTFFGIPEAPSILNPQYPNEVNPFFILQARTTNTGIVQYAEIWYSAFTNPLQEQMYFAGTSEIQSNGTPWAAYTLLPNITLNNIPAGNWYFFSRMVNSLASSAYSPASALLQWRPSTYQFSEKNLNVAYATSITGTGFSLNPRGKTYYGLFNTSSTSPSTNPADYTWYLAPSAFNTTDPLVYLLYSNRTGRKFSFATGFADNVLTTGSFVPTSDLIYPPSLWSGLPDGENNIDLDQRTGQLIQQGSTSGGYAAGQITVTNNNQGGMIASLDPFLQSQFGAGVNQVTSSAALITVDKYGRVVGFEPPDSFYYTQQAFTATSGQTVFSVTRGSNYISGQCWVMKNGLILDTTEYTDTGGSTGTVTLSVGATTGDIITITSFKSTSTLSLATTGSSGTGSVATLTFASRPRPPFIVGESITVTGVTPTGYNGTYTVTACTTTSVSYASTTTGSQTVAGTIGYTNNTYKSFTRNIATLTNQASYTASGFTLNNGYEFLFLNGTEVNAQDYDIAGQDIAFIANATGDLQIIQWNQDNLSLPNGSPTNVDAFTIIGQTIYAFSYNINAFNLFSNGVLFKQGTDYTTGTGSYTLANTPTTNTIIMTQQSFTRTGAV